MNVRPATTLARRWILILVVGLLVGRAGHFVVAANTEQYDPDNVAAHVTVLVDEIGVREAGTPNEGRAAAYIASELIDLGLDTRIQSFQAFNFYSQNVIATKPGMDEHAGILYIGAHYDSVHWGPGANDNASGTAVLLEVARILASEPLSPTVTFIAFGSEERSLGGSSAFIGALPRQDRLRARAMFNMDCVGWGTHQGVSAPRSGDDALAARTLAAASALGISLDVSDEGNSDHDWFSSIGIPAVALYAYDPDETNLCGPHYHKISDTSDTLDPEKMETIAQILLATVRDLSDDPVRLPHTVWLPSMERVSP